MTFGENLKTIRKELNLTQLEFAEKVGLSRSYLSDLENDRKNISIFTAIKMARTLSISVNKLINDDIELYKNEKKDGN